MNIFLLSLNILNLAIYHCDKHVVKMPTEICQMLYTAWCFLEGDDQDCSSWRSKCPKTKKGANGYRKTHVNHPISVWTRETRGNYIFAAKCGISLCKEYTTRYKKVHSTEEHLFWLLSNVPMSLFGDELTVMPQCMPEEYRHPDPKSNEDVMQAYRKFYNYDKSRFAKWKNRDTPYWFKNLSK